MCERLHMASFELSKRLEYVFGDEHSVKCRRALYRFLNGRYRDTDFFTHSIGSKSDGCHSKYSDYDTMHVLNNIYVADTSCRKHIKNAPLLAVTSPRSSYVQIQLNRISTAANLHVVASVIYYDRRLLICSSIFVKKHQLTSGVDIVGPSSVVTTSDGLSNDNVFTFKCKSWPKTADEWIGRQRKYSWPPSKLISFITSKGCHYVPVGDYNSKFNDVEWRVSFVLSECALVRSFNRVQFKVYGLMKLLKLHLSLITSYHVKTLIFFAIENSPTSMWSNENIVICFRMCLIYLRHFVISKYLPHYFLPQCNLLKQLSEAYHEHTHIVCELGRYILNPMILINLLLNDCSPLHHIQLIILADYSLLNVYRYSNDLKMCINSMLDNFHSFSDFEFTMITKITLDTFVCNDNCYGRDIQENNIVYKTKRKANNICLRRSHYDVAAGWLQLSNFYYVTQQYNKTEQICKKVLASLS